MRNALKVIGILVLVFTLFGCSDQTSKLKVLQEQVTMLSNANQTLQTELDQLKTIDYPTVYKLTGGAYHCPTFAGSEVREIRFLSNTLIHVTGRDFENSAIFDNYYIVEESSKNKYHLTQEVVVNDIRGPYKLDHLAATNFLVNIELSSDSKTINYSPFSTNHTCTFVSDNAPIN